MSGFLHDLKIAFRTLVATPWTTGAAVLILLMRSAVGRVVALAGLVILALAGFISYADRRLAYSAWLSGVRSVMERIEMTARVGGKTSQEFAGNKRLQSPKLRLV